MIYLKISFAILNRFMRRSIGVLLVLILLIMNTVPAFAAMPITQKDINSINKREYYRDPDEQVCATSTNTPTFSFLPGGSKVYVLGDSLTVGMRDAGQLEEKMVQKGWGVQKINAIGGKQLEWGDEQITADAALITESDAVVVGLGTNNVGTVMDGESNLRPNGAEAIASLVDKVIKNIKSQKASVKIYWTNVYITGTLTTEFGTFDLDAARPVINQGIEAATSANSVSVIPWGTSTQAPELLSSDGIHPSGKYPQMADYIVGQLAGTGGATVSLGAGCSCTTTDLLTVRPSKEERYQNTWNYLVTDKKLKPEAAAGLMGNLEAESGIDPFNTQNDAKDPSGNPVPDGPEIPIDLIRGAYGYGIAQWTSAGRQQALVDIAAQTNRSSGDLGLQLDFLWQELTTSYASVLATLQAANTTLEEASDEVVLHFEIPASVLPPPRGTAESKQSTIEARRAKSVAIFNTYSGLPAGSFVSSSCAGSEGAVTVDLEAVDTSGIPCAPGTIDADVVDAYREGKPYKIRICRVGGTTVNSQISGPIKNMFDKAASEGVALTGGSGFRDMNGQIGIYNKWCGEAGLTPTPGPYPKASYKDYVKCPGGAPPGYSNHQMGLAIDMVCSGSLIPMSYEDAKGNPCYVWLTQNAQKYGFFEFSKGANRTTVGYEAWHWSIDGT